MQKLKIKWQEPLKIAEKISLEYGEDSWCLLYSGLNEKIKNSRSYIAIFPQEKIIAENFSALTETLSPQPSSLAHSAEDPVSYELHGQTHGILGQRPRMTAVGKKMMAEEKSIKAKEKNYNNEKKWFGYLSYELGADFEKLPKSKNSFINLPKIHLINFAVTLEFDHDKKELTAFFSDEKKLNETLKLITPRVWVLDPDPMFASKDYKNSQASTLMQTWGQGRETQTRARLKTASHVDSVGSVKIKNLSSNFTDLSYISAITDIKRMIAEGDFYQTNLTRKFFGEFTKKQNGQEAFQLFYRLTKISPANYSSFLKLDKNYVISSSPELFFSIKNGKILSRPIKGTAPRSMDKKQDQKNKRDLKNSAKERAENLMIVDLVRNDLARICKAGSVKVKKLFAINSYQNVHHMSSEIHGEILPNKTVLQAIPALFPAGSMTGSPKIKAMEIAAKKEKINRGIYSGAIGYLSNSDTNLSVVIRTLIIEENKFEFQVGGAITFDSDAQAELQETFNKAKAIANLLQVDLQKK